MTIELKTMEKI